MKRCLICDDEELVRDALAMTVAARWPDVDIVTADSFAVAASLVAADSFDLCLTDLAMPGAAPRDGIAQLAEASDAPIVVITGLDDDALLIDLIARGVAGFLPKMSPAEIVVAAIELVLAGGRYIPPRVADLAIRQFPLPAPVADALPTRLTERQHEVLLLIARGLSNRDIAAQLGVSTETVKSHVAQVIGAIGSANRTAAVMKAKVSGLI